MIDRRQDARQTRHKTLLIASGKGGVGTSVITALAAITASERGDRVLLVDATESGGTLHHLFGVRPTHSLWMLDAPDVNPNEALVPIDSRLILVAGGTSGGATTPTTDSARRSALARLSQVYGDFDVVILDGGSRLDTISAIGDLTNPLVMLVTSADRLALAANYALVKSISSRRGDAPISVIANRHGDVLAEEACAFLGGACSHFLNRTVDLVGSIPDDACLQAAIGAGMTVREALDGSPAADTVRAILSRLLPSSRPTPGAVATFGSLPPSLSRRWS